MKKLLSLAAICLVTSCNHKNDDIGWKLRNPDEEIKNEIIANTATRFISSQVKMEYNDGGIMVEKCDSIINFYNLITGEEAEFTIDAAEENPALKINGIQYGIKKYEKLNEEGSDIWIRLIMEDNDSIEIVATDMAIV